MEKREAMTKSALFSILDTVDSTNNYAMAKLHDRQAEHGSCYMAREQTGGKGQRGKTWISTKDQDITMSIVIQPKPVFTTNSFILTALVSTTVVQFISRLCPDQTFKIKWPNDIYWNDKKTAGILIESKYAGQQWLWSILGIGVNLNAEKFDESLPNPISLKIICKKEYDPLSLGRELYDDLMQAINNTSEESINKIFSDYNDSLYQKNEWVKFKKENMVFESKVIEVNKYGELITEDRMGHQFHFSALQWVIESHH